MPGRHGTLLWHSTRISNLGTHSHSDVRVTHCVCITHSAYAKLYTFTMSCVALTAVASGRVVCTIGTQCTQPRVERQLKFMAVRDYLLVYLRYCLLPTAYCLLPTELPTTYTAYCRLPILPAAYCRSC